MSSTTLKTAFLAAATSATSLSMAQEAGVLPSSAATEENSTTKTTITFNPTDTATTASTSNFYDARNELDTTDNTTTPDPNDGNGNDPLERISNALVQAISAKINDNTSIDKTFSLYDIMQKAPFESGDFKRLNDLLESNPDSANAFYNHIQEQLPENSEIKIFPGHMRLIGSDADFTQITKIVRAAETGGEAAAMELLIENLNNDVATSGVQKRLGLETYTAATWAMFNPDAQIGEQTVEYQGETQKLTNRLLYKMKAEEAGSNSDISIFMKKGGPTDADRDILLQTGRSISDLANFDKKDVTINNADSSKLSLTRDQKQNVYNDVAGFIHERRIARYSRPKYANAVTNLQEALDGGALANALTQKSEIGLKGLDKLSGAIIERDLNTFFGGQALANDATGPAQGFNALNAMAMLGNYYGDDIAQIVAQYANDEAAVNTPLKELLGPKNEHRALAAFQAVWPNIHAANPDINHVDAFEKFTLGDAAKIAITRKVAEETPELIRDTNIHFTRNEIEQIENCSGVEIHVHEHDYQQTTTIDRGPLIFGEIGYEYIPTTRLGHIGSFASDDQSIKINEQSHGLHGTITFPLGNTDKTYNNIENGKAPSFVSIHTGGGAGIILSNIETSENARTLGFEDINQQKVFFIDPHVGMSVGPATFDVGMKFKNAGYAAQASSTTIANIYNGWTSEVTYSGNLNVSDIETKKGDNLAFNVFGNFTSDNIGAHDSWRTENGQPGTTGANTVGFIAYSQNIPQENINTLKEMSQSGTPIVHRTSFSQVGVKGTYTFKNEKSFIPRGTNISVSASLDNLHFANSTEQKDGTWKNDYTVIPDAKHYKTTNVSVSVKIPIGKSSKTTTHLRDSYTETNLLYGDGTSDQFCEDTGSMPEQTTKETYRIVPKKHTLVGDFRNVMGKLFNKKNKALSENIDDIGTNKKQENPKNLDGQNIDQGATVNNNPLSSGPQNQ